MKVFIFGASGFIGLPAAQAFIRAGHEVFGQTRSRDKANLLAAEEITPIVANLTDRNYWAPFVAKADIVIDCSGGNDIKEQSMMIFESVTAIAKDARRAGSPKMTYIYCSGTWVHGDDRQTLVSERSPPKNTTALVTWRIEHENRVTSSSDVDGIVIRPALLYGRSASLLHSLFEQASKGEIVWAGAKGGRWALIHTDDLADMFLRVAEAGPICKHLTFDASNDFTESVDDVLQKLTEISGAKSWSYRAPANPFEEAMTTTTLLRPSLGRALVGWKPKKIGLVDGLPTYYAAWRATVGLS